MNCIIFLSSIKLRSLCENNNIHILSRWWSRGGAQGGLLVLNFNASSISVQQNAGIKVYCLPGLDGSGS